jgi:hypothetical protein
MTGLALALAIQAMSQGSLISEGENVGRMTAVLGGCDAVGHRTIDAPGLAALESFDRRAVAAGWTRDVVIEAFQSGVELEKVDLAMDADLSSMTDDGLRRYAIETMGRIKRRCRDVAAEWPGAIVDIEAGERNADARLASMLRPLD